MSNYQAYADFMQASGADEEERERMMGLRPFILVRRLAGRCASGAEGDGGTLWHAVGGLPSRWGRALCGAKPGRLSAGWSDPSKSEPSCERCQRRLAKLLARAGEAGR